MSRQVMKVVHTGATHSLVRIQSKNKRRKFGVRNHANHAILIKPSIVKTLMNYKKRKDEPVNHCRLCSMEIELCGVCQLG